LRSPEEGVIRNAAAWLSNERLLEELEQLDVMLLKSEPRPLLLPPTHLRMYGLGLMDAGVAEAAGDTVYTDPVGRSWVYDETAKALDQEHELLRLHDSADIAAGFRELSESEDRAERNRAALYHRMRARRHEKIADLLDPPRKVGAPRKFDVDVEVLRTFYRRRVRDNRRRRVMLCQRPAPQTPDERIHLARERVVFKAPDLDEVTVARVTVADRSWPRLEALSYLAAITGLEAKSLVKHYLKNAR
jgi:hypothetical protein